MCTTACLDVLLHSLGSIEALEADLTQVLDAVGLVDLQLRLVFGACGLGGVAGSLLGGLYCTNVFSQTGIGGIFGMFEQDYLRTLFFLNF